MLRYHPQEDEASSCEKKHRATGWQKNKPSTIRRTPQKIETQFVTILVGFYPAIFFGLSFFVMRIPDSPQTKKNRPTIIYQFYSLGLDASNFYK